ncbi:MAG: 16S rRNA (guanine(527)-N(7))-methyltransferase RsmG [Bacteroidia bacterium]|jgi:16S rRNA (guanine527-N7)-methyltransferase|nr:16S rRNA (guanine(527)-N(7))-methyltransferase RsmG [Bacteroidia bacterium]
MDIILKYFPDLTPHQIKQFDALYDLYAEANSKVNLISRKDIESLYLKHILHALTIAKFTTFVDGTRILDLGTGGGFPGIPLAIMFPKVHFTLCDSIAKKILIAESIAETIALDNIDFVVGRAENLKEKYEFVVSRAVAPMEQLYRWTQSYIDDRDRNPKINGYLLLKGGDLKQEIRDIKSINRKLFVDEHLISQWFEEDFFETKKLIYIYRF